MSVGTHGAMVKPPRYHPNSTYIGLFFVGRVGHNTILLVKMPWSHISRNTLVSTPGISKLAPNWENPSRWWELGGDLFGGATNEQGHPHNLGGLARHGKKTPREVKTRVNKGKEGQRKQAHGAKRQTRRHNFGTTPGVFDRENTTAHNQG